MTVTTANLLMRFQWNSADWKVAAETSSELLLFAFLLSMSAAGASEIFDSLPYYDDDLEKYPILKQKVEQELAREPKPPQALHPRVPPPITLFAVRTTFIRCCY